MDEPLRDEWLKDERFRDEYVSHAQIVEVLSIHSI